MKSYAPVFHLLLFFFFFFFFFVHGADNSYLLLQNDKETMRALSTLLPISSSNYRYWNTTHLNPCYWERVLCSSGPSSRITDLYLDDLGLPISTNNNSSASLFFELLCRLDSLQSLDLSFNYFDFIPTSFFSNCSGLSGLKALDLGSNRLTGPLSNFSSFRALEYLDLSVNLLSGPIPNEIFQSGNLIVLDLSGNKLSGTVPEWTGGAFNLEGLYLSSNSLFGEIPGSLSSIKSLKWFAADHNDFVGTIPVGIARYLLYLDLSYNGLTGVIPSDLLSPPGLEYVDLTSNLLEGPMPENISQSLYHLQLGGNSLSGAIPSEIFSLQGLSILNLEGNNLGGSIPRTINNLEFLSELQLGNNRLTEMVPRMPTSLTSVNLSNNLFSGYIPSQLGDLLELQILDLSNNDFTGMVPSSLAQLPSLKQLVLSNNQLSGPLPQFPQGVIVNSTDAVIFNITGNKDKDTSTRSLGIHSVLIMIAAFVCGFVAACLVARFVQAAISRCFYQVKHESTSARSHSSRPAPLNELDKMRRIQRQLHAANLR